MIDYRTLLIVLAGFLAFYLLSRQVAQRRAAARQQLHEYTGRKGWALQEERGELELRQYRITPQSGDWVVTLREPGENRKDRRYDGLTEFRAPAGALPPGQILLLSQSLPQGFTDIFARQDQGGLIGFASDQAARRWLPGLVGLEQAQAALAMQPVDLPPGSAFESLATIWPDWLDLAPLEAALAALQGITPPAGTRFPAPALWLDDRGLALRLHFRSPSMTAIETLIAAGERLSAQLRDQRARA